MNAPKFVKKVVFLACLAATAGCSDGGGPETGTVSISLMDRPVDGVTQLWVTIDQIRVKPQGDGPPIPLQMTESPITVNLLAHGDENAAILVDRAGVEAGSYSWVEFTVDDADVAYSNAMLEDGRTIPVEVDVPGGRIRLANGFVVEDNEAVEFMFDWNARAGVAWAADRDVLLLRPAFRVLDANEYGSISGEVSAEAITNAPGCDNTDDPSLKKVVYVFDEDDLDVTNPPDGLEPHTTVDVDTNVLADHVYRAVVMPGTYTLGLACETEADAEPGSYLPPAAGNPVEVTAAAEPAEGVDV